MRSREAPPASLLYQDLNLAQRVLRDMSTDETSRILVDSRETFVQDAGLRAPVHAGAVRPHQSLHRRPAAVRPARRRGRDREGARAPRRSEVRRLSDHRPDRGDDDDRRQHRRLRRRPQLRRHDLQDQPRGGAGDRAAAAPAQPRRHHHHRLHRHGERRPPQRGARGTQQGAGEGPHAAHGERLHAARPGRDDAQAHARIAGARAVRALPDLPGPRRAQDRADDLLRDPARDRARVEAVQRARVPHPRRRSR